MQENQRDIRPRSPYSAKDHQFIVKKFLEQSSRKHKKSKKIHIFNFFQRNKGYIFQEVYKYL